MRRQNARSKKNMASVQLKDIMKVYPFVMNDWCGYIQGAALFRSRQGGWSIYYTVPDAANRPKTAVFV